MAGGRDGGVRRVPLLRRAPRAGRAGRRGRGTSRCLSRAHPVTASSARVLTVGVLADLPEGLGGGVNYFTRALVRSLITMMPADMRLVVFAGEEDQGWV